LSKKQILQLKERFEFEFTRVIPTFAISNTAEYMAREMLDLPSVRFEWAQLPENVIARASPETVTITYNFRHQKMLSNFWNFYHITLHELGHIRGLDHSHTYVTDVMAPVWRGV